jgi:hypothetical protein
MTTAEKIVTPAAAQLRKELAQKYDGHRQHRIADACDGFSLSVTASYVVGPHDDSGLANEFILFANRHGALPDGHAWLFAVGGCILELPMEKGGGVHVSLPGSGVYHGTLPTSSTGPTYQHGNLGSALVTKISFINACIAQQERDETTPDSFTASRVYNLKRKRDA